VKIGQAAKRLKIPTSALRSLERRGIISAPRSNCGHRDYTEAEVDMIQQKLFPGGEGTSSSSEEET
jgi:DNA-binding transcriptional MerR regulator